MRYKALLVVISSLCILLAACSSNVESDVATDYEKEAHTIIELLYASDFEAVYQRFDTEMQKALPIAKLEELTPVIQEAGEFVSFKKTAVDEKDGLYVVTTVAEYSKEKRVFTLTFDQEKQVKGLFIN
ncbi:hypothetical protein GCM10007425_25270 [Lysinibacillus alkalisoli]|uniref:DUF3887 domain-containing protein n=1 Tax=Lysinibacillus alkalisoli TaxID=1911548 RepID=A0A917LJ96_9BACI|nr:DUF3887 domain-containing protein [Lysinibacillus alkalisoli]GGG29579.1 hypothetical protein GCM10007425_25270 [Lysinibacillus alkalisoli]